MAQSLRTLPRLGSGSYGVLTHIATPSKTSRKLSDKQICWPCRTMNYGKHLLKGYFFVQKGGPARPLDIIDFY